MTHDELVAEHERLCIVADMVGVPTARATWRSWHRTVNWDAQDVQRLEGNIRWFQAEITKIKDAAP